MELLNDWMTLIANFGVVAGIVFLAVEIQQNTNMMQAQTRSTISQISVSLFSSDSVEEGEIFLRGSRGELEAPSPEWFFFQGRVQAILKTWENEHFQHQQGLYGQDLLKPRQTVWARLVNAPGVQAVWQNSKIGYAPAFRQVIDELISKADEGPEDWLDPSTD